MKDIFTRDLNGEMVSPSDPGYDALINDIFSTMETAQKLHHPSRRKNRVRIHHWCAKRSDTRRTAYDHRCRKSGKNHKKDRAINSRSRCAIDFL